MDAIVAVLLSATIGVSAPPRHDIASVQAHCPAPAVAVVDSAVARMMRGALLSVYVYHQSGMDTLGFHEDFRRKDYLYVARVNVRCISSSASRAAFELTWTADARLHQKGARDTVTLGMRTGTDTLVARRRWMLEDDMFLVTTLGPPVKRFSWLHLSRAQLRRIDSLAAVFKSTEGPRGELQRCQPAARDVLNAALADAAAGALMSSKAWRTTGMDTLSFDLTEDWGDYVTLVAAVDHRCLDKRDNQARFEVTRSLLGPVQVGESSAEINGEPRTAVDTVLVARRWVVQDFASLNGKFGHASDLDDLFLQEPASKVLDSLAHAHSGTSGG